MNSDDLYELYGIKKARINNDNDDTDTPVWITSLPESVYSTAIMSPLWILKPIGCNFETFFGVGILWSLCYICILMQGLCIYFIYDIIKDNTDCNNSNSILQLISLVCFTSIIWNDIFETIKLLTYIYLLPISKKIDGKLVENIKFDHTGQGIDFVKENKSGISIFYRKIVIIFILLPKILVACFLWIYGSKYILYSLSNELVLLNSVSLVFILDIDDYIYKAVISDYVKNTLINDWPKLYLCRKELNLSGNSFRASCRNKYGFYSGWAQIILPILIGLLCFIAKIFFC
jgi:hypothetical protein